MAYTAEDLSLLIRDPDFEVFSEEQVEMFQNLYPDSILRAAAIAFQSLAAEYATQGRSIKTDDLSVDIRSRGKDLLEVARSFAADADAEDATGAADFFQVVPLGGGHGHCVRPEATPWPVPCSSGGFC